MKQEQLDKLRAWFDDYVAGFYGDDEYINANLELKEKHSRRTCEQMLYLVDELGLDTNQKMMAEVTALFHDIGRFEQFVKYRTYNDIRSINHCLLGLEVLKKTGVFGLLETKERQVVEKAIEYHGVKELPKNLNGQHLLFSKLIRDADKLDVFYVMTELYRQYRQEPESFSLELELPDEPGYSSEVVEQIMRGQQIDYSKLKTLNDLKLMELAWVYDVNFTPTLKRIKQGGFLEAICEDLPQTSDIEKAKIKVLKFVDSRIESADNSK